MYFDGLCNLCNWFVDFLAKRDRRNRFRFASLQGETARSRLPSGLAGEALETVVLEERDRFRFRSDAILAILAGLGGIWRGVAVLRILPRPGRDLLYNYVARKRLAWFGRRDSCRVPSPAERTRFLP